MKDHTNYLFDALEVGFHFKESNVTQVSLKGNRQLVIIDGEPYMITIEKL